MLKQIAQLEVVKDDRVYSLSLPSSAPLGEVHDVLFQMRSYVVERINEATKADSPKVEEPKVEEV